MASIVSDARRLHQGVYCSRALQDDATKKWHYENAVAEGAILLAVMVDALGEILQMVVETVRCLRTDSRVLKDSALVEHGKEACELLKAARDQLIREASGQDKNGNVGPVVTPEAITTSLLERLSFGVLGRGTVDIIHLYEECLEHLVGFSTLYKINQVNTSPGTRSRVRSKPAPSKKDERIPRGNIHHQKHT